METAIGADVSTDNIAVWVDPERERVGSAWEVDRCGRQQEATRPTIKGLVRSHNIAASVDAFRGSGETVRDVD